MEARGRSQTEGLMQPKVARVRNAFVATNFFTLRKQRREVAKRCTRCASDAFADEPLGVLLQNAAVLDDLEARGPGPGRRLFMSDALLHPDRAGAAADRALDKG